MKAKEILFLLGMKPRARKFGYEFRSFYSPVFGEIKYAQWMHPKTYKMECNERELSRLSELVQPGDVVIDVGAHAGDSTLPLALACGTDGCVLAFEPNTFVYPVLEANSKLNTDKTNIIPLNVAATEEDCELEFEYSDPGFCNGGRHKGISRWRHGHAFNQKVQGRNLDRLLEQDHSECRGRVSYIKTDAEGYDLSVLKSLEGTIKECRPYVQSEIYKLMAPEERHGVVDLMHSLDYRITFHDPAVAGFGDGQEIGHDNIESWPNYDVFCQPLAA
ncbi:hypothetical protein FF011L_42710 [Roseimaritima multifibrata]|uniref:Methyltransferase FkbM domain-containing protein n=1 Tax=Roseimaritima multifibrata TaxID=1930274 RepID=A0A517MKQ4_9BACT|nr:FkbM family methyltransferase [Roseimaritima multifibrata]QDS95475.1 hypothetical protein FF011L_42710 [Roseimaritima multifibrata]